jgi:hypothetical protein
MNMQKLPQLPSRSLFSRVRHALRYRFSPSYRKTVDEAGEWSMRRLEAAHALMEEEREILEDAWPRLGFQLKEDMIQAFETHMLWGLFNEAEKLRSHLVKTSLDDRTMLHVMFFLMLYRGFNHPDAVREVQAMKAEVDAGDRFITVMVDFGRDAAAAGDRGQLLNLVIAFHDSGLKPDSYA